MNITVINIKQWTNAREPWSVCVMRGKSVLGNPAFMHSESERIACIEKFRKWLWAEMNRDGKPMREMLRLEALYKKYGRLELVCC